MAADGKITVQVTLDEADFMRSMNGLPRQANSSLGKTLAVYDLFKQGVMKIWGMITDSVSSAMSRLDTMDQFSRVMTTMLGSTEKANKALDATTKIVTGTAFGLDTAAKGVQAFVASGMEVSKATDTMGAWADAVAFYTKGTNEDLGTVSNALQKMQTKGTVTMEHLQMLLEAGIPAVEIYAAKVGMSTDEVTDAMSRGQLSTDDFITAMNDAFNNGAGKFPQIAGAAKEAGSSWQGSMDNMKAAVTRGVGECLTAFDKMFNVKGGMVNFGKAIEQVLKFIGQNLETIIPVIGVATGAWITYKAAMSISGVIKTVNTALKALGSAMDTIAIQTSLAMAAHESLTTAELQEIMTAGGLTATQAAQATIINLVSAGMMEEAIAATQTAVSEGALNAATILQTAALGVLSGEMTIAEAVQWAWNAAMEANPIAMVIILFAALVAGLIVLTQALKSEAYKQHEEEINRIKDAHEELRDSMESSANAYAEQESAISKEAIATENALEKLKYLEEQGASTEAQQQVLADTVEQLNEKYENLNMTVEEFEANPEAARARIESYAELSEEVSKYEAQLSRMETLEDEHAQAQQGLRDIEIERALIQQQLADGEINVFEAGSLMNELFWQAKDYNDTLKETQTNIDALAKITDDAAGKEAQALKNRTDALNGMTDSEGRNLKQIARDWGLTEDEILDALEESGKDIAEWAEDNKKYYTKDGQNLAQLAKKWGVTEDEIKKYIDEMGTDADDWVAQMESNFTKSGMDLEMLADKWGMTVDEVKAYCDEWGMTYDEFNEHMKETHTEAGEDIEQLAEKWGVSVEEIQKWIAQNESDLQGWSDMMDADMQAWEDSVTDHTDNVINDWERLPEKYDKSLDEMIEIAQENAAKYAEWSDKMAYLSQHMSAESIGYLEELGPAGLSVIDELLDGGVPKMQEFDKAVSGTARDAAVNAANNFSTISPAMIETFNELNSASGLYMNEFGDILNKHSGEAIASASQILSGDELPESIGTALDNTKAVLEQKGAENTAVAAETAQNTANASVDGYVNTTAERAPEVSQAGANTAQQYGEGISSSSSPQEAADTVAGLVVTALENADYSGITQGITDAVQKGSKNTESAVQTLSTNLLNIVKQMSANIANEAKTMMSKIQQGINNGRNATVNIMQNVLTSVKTAAVNKAQEFIEIGKAIMDKVAGGMSGNSGAVSSAVLNALNGAKSPDISGYTTLGYNMSLGIAQGVKNGNNEVANAVRKVVSNALAAGKNEAQVNSPSKLFGRQLGSPIPEGVALYISKGIPEAVDSVKDMIGAMADTDNSEFSRLIQASAAAQKGLSENFTAQKLYNAAQTSAIPTAALQTSNSNVVNNFEQNNTIVNPPTTPSQAYRKTRAEGRRLLRELG